MHEDTYDENDDLEIIDAPPAALPDPITALAVAADQAADLLHLLLDALACDDPRNGTLPFSRDIESALDRLADVRAHLRGAYPARGE